MTINNKACVFTIKAFDEVIKDKNSNVTKLIESLITGMILDSYGFDKNLVAAGYLSKVVGNTSFTCDDISKLFGGDIASLLLTSNDNISIDNLDDCDNKVKKIVEGLPLRNAILLCANKVVELETLDINLKDHKEKKTIKGSKTFSELKDYYYGYYEAIGKIFRGQLYDRLKDNITNVFESEMEVENVKLGTSYNPYNELVKLRDVISHNNPYIVELTSCEEIFDSSLKGLILDFFDNADLRIRSIDEEQNPTRYESQLIENKAGISPFEKHLLLTSALKDDLMYRIIGDQKIMILQNGLYDVLLYLKKLLKKKLMTKEELMKYLDYYLPDLEYLINSSVIGYKELKDFEIQSEYDNDLIAGIENIMKSSGQSEQMQLDSHDETIVIAGTLLPILDNPYILKKIVRSKTNN